MKKLFVVVVMIALVACLVLAGCATSQTPTPEIKLKVVTCIPGTHVNMVGFMTLLDVIRGKSKDGLVLDYLGGPEAIPTFEQAKAVQDGVVDISCVPASFYEGVVPAALAMMLSEFNSTEMRKNGAWDAIQSMHQKAGFYVLGLANPQKEAGQFFTYFTNKRANSPAELAGQKYIGGAKGKYWAEALGLTPVMIPPPEEYTALERGVVDASLGVVAVVASGQYEVLKYAIDCQYLSDNMVALINLGSWNRIPKNLQDKILEAQLQHERDFPAVYEKIVAKSWQKCKDGGMQIIKWSPADCARSRELMLQGEWRKIIEKYPDEGPKWKKLLSK